MLGIRKLTPQKQAQLWFVLSMIVALYFGGMTAFYALTQPYVVQDDVRQHVVWMHRFIDGQLFPEDFIANYYLSTAPIGYQSFFVALARLGIEPLTLAKILPLLLGIPTTAYMFGVAMQIMPVPASAFLTTLIFNQSIWLKDDIASATPRAFLYPLFAAFLYYLLKRSLLPVLIIIALQGLFFPQFVLIEAGILTVRLLDWRDRRIRLSRQRSDYVFWAAGLAVAGAVLLPFALSLSEFGSVVTAAQMQAMPEFGLGGRSQYFGVHPLRFAITGGSGLRAPVRPPIIWVSVLLPFLLRAKSPSVRAVTPQVKILVQVILTSFGWFFLAHFFLLKLYFPSRYTYHTLRFVMAFAAGIALFHLIQSSWRWWQQHRPAVAQHQPRTVLLSGLLALFFAATFGVPAIPYLFLTAHTWKVGKNPEIYQFLAQQPPQTLIASLDKEADNLPAFALRPVLVSGEFAISYHMDYYGELEQRAAATIEAQYSPDLAAAKAAIDRYGIDFFLVEKTAFSPDYLRNQRWIINSSFRSTALAAIQQLEQGAPPAFERILDQCAAVVTETHVLLDADCIQQQPDVRDRPAAIPPG